MTHTRTQPAADLAALIETVQRNERALKCFQEVELRLIGAHDWGAFLEGAFVYLPEVLRLTSVTIWLDGRAPLLRDLLESGCGRADLEANLKTGVQGGLALSRLCVAHRPWLGRVSELDPATGETFFGAQAATGSAIVLPLVNRAQVLGYLCVASEDPERFDASMATDLLTRFASVAAASLDNVAHREHLRTTGVTDPLTGLSNRRYFDERLHQEIRRASAHAAPMSCLFIDIDHFKQINDTHGHALGDLALGAVGTCLKQHVRVGDTVSRYGGEEFVALLMCDLHDALAVAERIRRAIEAIELHDDQGARIALSVSIGVAAYQLNAGAAAAGTPEALARTLLDEADQAMYQAKHQGRNRVSLLAAHS
ncbi:MAG TPA: sensor domain-containing diguanylate cyclase [Paraburkholderia sp.]|uniref:GGDEF domain-containing protein n=1 Tax=Paraburkholderia sp. TaxID=1926495 RepID=UPI002C8E10B4|nr:sensor domain-containing diguanylate cyclase [Paraburkholderia sp.]HTR08537.1 sensor domain-containing diguanylate cyclase [Paraburkholderia sp.]